MCPGNVIGSRLFLKVAASAGKREILEIYGMKRIILRLEAIFFLFFKEHKSFPSSLSLHCACAHIHMHTCTHAQSF